MMTDLGLGLVVGVILALTGAGGGILAVPLLVFGVQLSVVQAAPIGLLAVGMAAGLGAIFGLREGIVRYRGALLIAASGMLLSPIGIWLAHRIDNRWLSVLFALILLLVALNSFRRAREGEPKLANRDQKLHPCMHDAVSGRFVWTSACARALVLSGMLAGLLSGLLGVGGGFVVVPALQRYTDLAMQSIVATSLAVIALVSVTGVVTSAAMGGITWAVALPFSAGTLSGMLGGHLISARLAGPHLQIGFAIVSVLVAIGMLAKALF
jgi:uncharacterized membrane protein YfcA